MTYLALPWFVLVTTGSAVEDDARPRRGDRADGDLRHPERDGGRAARRADDDARLRRGARPAARRRCRSCTRPACSASRCCSGSSSLLGCFMAPYFAAQRVILPELVGEDETTIAQANSVIEGGTAFAALAGPALAGILIPFLGAPNVLYVDAATYAVSFLLLAGFVPKTKRLGQARGARRARRDPVPAPRQAGRAAERHGDRAQLPRRGAVGDAARTTRTTASPATRRSPGSSSPRSAPARCSAASARSSWSSASSRCGSPRSGSSR